MGAARADENVLWQSEAQYRQLFATMIEGFCIIEVIFDARNLAVDYRFLEVNAAFERQTGLQNVRGKCIRELVPENEAYWYDIYGRIALTGEPVRFMNKVQAFNRWYDVSAFRFGDADSRKVAILFNDITQIKKNAEGFQRLNRTLQALSRSDRAFMHSQDEKTFLDEVCRIVVEDCGYRMVWIGLAMADANKTVRPVAAAGFVDGYLEQLNVTWDDTERGRGPSGTAIRTGRLCMCGDIRTDPIFAPWCTQAIRRGYVAALALPMVLDATVSADVASIVGPDCKGLGVITIYSAERDVFTPDEIALLSRLAADLAHGIALLRLRAAAQRVSQDREFLAQSMERLRLAQAASNTIQAMQEGVMLLELDGVIISVNPAVERMAGLTDQAFVGHNIQDLLPRFVVGADLETARRGLEDLREGRLPEFPPLLMQNSEGQTFRILASVSLIGATADGQRQMAVLTLKDVTELHETARRLRELAERLAVTEEEERWRISRHIHDSVIQTLSLSNIRLGGVVKALQGVDLPVESEKVTHIREALREAIDECRSIMSTLTPALLYELGLFSAVKDFSQRMEVSHATPIAVECAGDDATLAHPLRGLLFEALRELITNALKHAGPCVIQVSITIQATELVASVSDNGLGFVSTNPMVGFGLLNIRQRVEGLGGRLEIESAPGIGTQATIYLRSGLPAR